MGKRPRSDSLRKTQVIRFRLTQFEYDILTDACFLDAHAIDLELEKRGLSFGANHNLHSPAEWARDIVLNVAVEKLRSAKPKERKLLEEIRAEMRADDERAAQAASAKKGKEAASGK